MKSNFKTWKDFVNESNENEKVEDTDSKADDKKVEENEDDNLGIETEDELDSPSEGVIPSETNLENIGEIAEDINTEINPEDLDIQTDIESDGELDGNTIPEDGAEMGGMLDAPMDDLPMELPMEEPMTDYPAYGDIETPIELPTELGDNIGLDVDVDVESANVAGCKIVIINGCEPESTTDTKTDELKEKLDCDCDEIYLYQLNIQSVKKTEPRDGMEMIYSKIEEADAVIFACESKKGALSEELKNVIDRLKAHYVESELRNKVFGTIIIGKEDNKIKDDMILCAINDLGMIVGGDCVYVGTGESADLTTMALCIANLCDATISIRGSVSATDNVDNDNVEAEIDNYGEFVDREQSEDPTDLALGDDLPEEGTEENDSFVDALKGNLEDAFGGDDEDDSEEKEDEDDEDEDEDSTDDSEEDSEEESDEDEDEDEDDSTEEEEERVIDNLDGTITHIHNGHHDTNKPKGAVKESLDIKNFSDFFKG